MTKDTLDFEEGIQRSILFLCKADIDYLTQILAMLKPEYFESDVHAKIFRVIRDYYYKYRALPDDSQIIEDLKPLLTEKEFLGDYRQELTSINSTDVSANSTKEYLLDKVEKFAQKQAMVEALIGSVELVNSGHYEKVRERVSAALQVGRSLELGSYYGEDFESRYQRLTSTKNCIGRTPFEKLNEQLDEGGFGRGEIAMVIAPTGVGKSIYLVNQAVESAKEGLNVAYISLEMSEDRIEQRIDSCFTRIPITELKNRVSDIKYRLSLINNKLIETKGFPLGKIKVKQFPTKCLSMSQLRAYLQQLKNYENFVPDVLIIDYLDLMSEGEKATYEAQQDTVEHLRGLAIQSRMLVWTATQTNREAHKVTIITEREVGDSYGKLRPCEFIFSINQTTAEKEEGKARLFIIKNRNGVSKFVHNIKIEASKMVMQDA
jgi:replicative DNA helicase